MYSPNTQVILDNKGEGYVHESAYEKTLVSIQVTLLCILIQIFKTNKN